MSRKSNNDENDSVIQISAALRTFAITELREMIMDHLDIPTLFGIVAALPAALQSFQRYHRRYFESTLAPFSPNWRYLAIALLALPEEGLSDEATIPCPRCQCVQSGHYHFFPKPQWENGPPAASPLELYLDQYLNSSNNILPESIAKPVEKLKKLASIVEAVEYLSTAPIWTFVASPQCGASSVESIGLVSELPEIQQITVALWQFEVYCAIYPQKGGHKPIESQQKFALMINGMTALEVFVRVYLDLIRLLGTAYQDNIILSFEDVYKRRTNALMNEQCNEEGTQQRDSRGKMGIDRANRQENVQERIAECNEGRSENWSDRALGIEVHDDFLAFVDYHASLGLVFAARILRIISDPNCPSSVEDLPKQRHKSTCFLWHALCPPFNWGSGPDIHDYWNFEAFELEPCKDGRSGYHLRIELKYIGSNVNGNHLLEFKHLAFSDGFEPSQLGSLEQRSMRSCDAGYVVPDTVLWIRGRYAVSTSPEYNAVVLSHGTNEANVPR